MTAPREGAAHRQRPNVTEGVLYSLPLLKLLIVLILGRP
jgi:hypothetical protein